MTGEDLYNAMSDIEPGFILDAAPMASRCQRLRLQRWLCAAACLCLLFHLLTIGATVYENTLPSRYTAENAADLEQKNLLAHSECFLIHQEPFLKQHR